MKRVLVILSILTAFSACAPKLDKKAELDKLIKERDKITEQINKLQKELASDTGGSKKIVNVAVTEVIPKTFKHYIEVQGKVDGDENVAVSARGTGVVLSINVDEGQKVSKGQILAVLDAQVLYASLADMENQLTFVADIYDRQKNLWDQKIGSEIQYLTAKNNKENLENNIKSLKEQMDMDKILAPINGTIEDMPIKVGQAVAPGAIAFRVVNLSNVKVVADIAEAYSAKLKKGNEVNINFPDLDKEITSKISFSSKFINPTNRTFSVEIALDNDDESYRANMIAVVKINDYHADSTIIVPINVIQKLNGDDYIYIAEKKSDNKYAAKKVKVKIGQIYNGYAEILNGLKEGDKLITVGYQNIEDGQLLKF